MIDTEAIKTRILDFAMHGKLTKQVSEDGIAEDLYCLIQEEKKKKSKTKKNKTAVISEDEILFDIPDNWKWVHLDDIASSMLGKTLNKSTDKGENCPYLCSINVYWDGISLENVKQAKFDIASKEKYRLEKGDLLICEGGDSGRSAVWNGDEEMYYQNALHRVRFYGGINPYYFCRVFEYYKKTGIIANYTTGIGIQHLVQNSLNSIWLPLPPISEQERIVERIDEIFETLDKIDHLQNQYASNQEVLKSKLIDAAIQGKLTEQLPEDGTAEELYKQIQSETQILIKEGRFKKKKALPDLSDVDYPFQIPKTWKWIHLGDLISIESGKGLTAAEMIPGDVPVYGGNGITGYHDNGFVPEGTIVIGRVGYYCGSVHVTQKESWVTDNAFITTYPENCIDKWFLVYVLRKMRLGQNNNGSAQPVVSGKKIYPLAFPLPPLAEQNRIADLFKTIIPMCESTK